MLMDRKTIGFIGAGNMAFAIAEGIPNPVCLYDRNAKAYEKFISDRYTVCASISELVNASNLIVLSVKPQNFADVLPEIAAAVSEKRRVILSIAAGITLETLENALPGQPVIRVMPNTPLLVGEGAAVLCRGKLASDSDFAEAKALFAAGGVTAEITEDKMNAEIAIHGSSPAIFFEMADRVMKYGSSIGLEERDALQLFCQTMIGSAKMMLLDSRSPKELSRAVCSPGGTTLAMLDQLEKYRWLEGLEASFVACTRRAEELSGK